MATINNDAAELPPLTGAQARQWLQEHAPFLLPRSCPALSPGEADQVTTVQTLLAEALTTLILAGRTQDEAKRQEIILGFVKEKAAADKQLSQSMDLIKSAASQIPYIGPFVAAVAEILKAAGTAQSVVTPATFEQVMREPPCYRGFSFHPSWFLWGGPSRPQAGITNEDWARFLAKVDRVLTAYGERFGVDLLCAFPRELDQPAQTLLDWDDDRALAALQAAGVTAKARSLLPIVPKQTDTLLPDTDLEGRGLNILGDRAAFDQTPEGVACAALLGPRGKYPDSIGDFDYFDMPHGVPVYWAPEDLTPPGAPPGGALARVLYVPCAWRGTWGQTEHAMYTRVVIESSAALTEAGHLALARYQLDRSPARYLLEALPDPDSPEFARIDKGAGGLVGFVAWLRGRQARASGRSEMPTAPEGPAAAEAPGPIGLGTGVAVVGAGAAALALLLYLRGSRRRMQTAVPVPTRSRLPWLLAGGSLLLAGGILLSRRTKASPPPATSPTRPTPAQGTSPSAAPATSPPVPGGGGADVATAVANAAAQVLGGVAKAVGTESKGSDATSRIEQHDAAALARQQRELDEKLAFQGVDTVPDYGDVSSPIDKHDESVFAQEQRELDEKLAFQGVDTVPDYGDGGGSTP